jgi:phosphonate transport system permease protein
VSAFDAAAIAGPEEVVPEIPPPPRPAVRSWKGAGTVLTILALVAVFVISWRETDFSIAALVDGWHGMADFLGDAIPPDLSWDQVLHPAIDASLVTLYIAFLGTALSIPFALLFAILGARTTTPNVVVYQASRSLLSFLRAVPDVVFALVFVTAVGLGPFPGVLALLFHNVGVMGKLWSESIEEIDLGPVEALRTTGARGSQVVANAVVPAVTPQFIGLLLYRFDVNVRASLVLGLVGAGGIGFLINESIKLFRFDEMLTYILVVLVLVVAVDNLSALIRRRIA